MNNFFTKLAVTINNPITPYSVRDLIIYIVDRWAIPIAGIIAVAFLVYGGVQYITAAGAEDKIKNAVRTITGAVIGLILVMAAVAIRNTVFKAIGKPPY